MTPINPDDLRRRNLAGDLRARLAIRKAVTDLPDSDLARARSESTKMLAALGATGRRVYEGTVPAAVVARRRARNKRARKARRANR